MRSSIRAGSSATRRRRRSSPSRPAFTASSSSRSAAATSARFRPSTGLPRAGAICASVRPPRSCSRSSASGRPRYVAAASRPPSVCQGARPPKPRQPRRPVEGAVDEGVDPLGEAGEERVALRVGEATRGHGLRQILRGRLRERSLRAVDRPAPGARHAGERRPVPEQVAERRLARAEVARGGGEVEPDAAQAAVTAVRRRPEERQRAGAQPLLRGLALLGGERAGVTAASMRAVYASRSARSSRASSTPSRRAASAITARLSSSRASRVAAATAPPAPTTAATPIAAVARTRLRRFSMRSSSIRASSRSRAGRPANRLGMSVERP